MNNATLHNETLPLIITNNSDNTVCIAKDITVGTSEIIGNDSYNINEITIAARPNDIKPITQPVRSLNHSDKCYTLLNSI